MEATATINVRLQEQLKQNGSRVLERNGVSPTEVVRSLYRYMDRYQKLPECLDVASGEDESVYQRRRALLHRFDGFSAASCKIDCKTERAHRIEEKYGDLL